MRVSEVWLIYILVVVISYIIIHSLIGKNTVDIVVKLFFAMLIGAILILILIPGITADDANSRTFYSLLLLVAFIVPLIIAVYIFITGRYKNMTGMLGAIGDKMKLNGDHLEQEVECDGDKCNVVKETHTAGDKKTTTIFRTPVPYRVSPRGTGRRRTAIEQYDDYQNEYEEEY